MRLSYARNPDTGSIDVLDRNDYYPFGMNMQGVDSSFDTMGSFLNHKYNRKELQETGFYDYGWRQYMPDLGRWFGMDKLSETYSSTSPYAYVMNNPAMNFDPDGRYTQGSGDNWLQDMWDNTTSYSSWTNTGNGSFTGGEIGMTSEQFTSFFNFLSGGGSGSYTYWTNAPGRDMGGYNSSGMSVSMYGVDAHKITIKDNGWWSDMLDKAAGFMDSLVFKIEGTSSFGVQLGGKTSFGSLEGGFWTATIGKFGWSNKDGGYIKSGDGKGHNFLGGSVKFLSNKLSVGGNVDYVTNDIIPPNGSDLIDYYANNGNLEGQANFGSAKSIISSPKGSAAEALGVSLKSRLNAGNKEGCSSCITISAGVKAFLGIEGKITVGIK
ncbi:RHS repeat-associated core domain-containing protein [Epilithonimonas hungarica]|uniref:RHS repeat-associated core domain-containing protein n=1 Tax=Epilithonimonas hungarica TaxID=454006 RepID=UPI0011140A1B|nr:RHS repeat-associated core domain-containing protein [Epilithonimonas hungarica]